MFIWVIFILIQLIYNDFSNNRRVCAESNGLMVKSEGNTKTDRTCQCISPNKIFVEKQNVCKEKLFPKMVKTPIVGCDEIISNKLSIGLFIVASVFIIFAMGIVIEVIKDK